MKKIVLLLSFLLTATLSQAQVLVGMTDTAAYFPILHHKKIAVLANQTAMAPMGNQNLHLVDLLHNNGFQLTAILSPEHGFRGTADAGQSVADSVDTATGTPIRSLYNGNTQRPSDEVMRSFDVLVIDIQDVGVRFYTYYITMLRMMDACSLFGHTVVVLDRPNPIGDCVDGPILESKYKSGVGALPIPVAHGLTMGEIALMSVGEGWAKPCDLHVIPCRNYTHATEYRLPVAPSPNLPTQRSIYLYPSLCLMEGTIMSVGRGTETPFECYGHPNYHGGNCTFTPHSTAGAHHPVLEGKRCKGVSLTHKTLAEAKREGFSLRYVMDAYRKTGRRADFFTPMFEKLVGTARVRRMIQSGYTEAQIRATWQKELSEYKKMRSKYLLYK